MDINETCFVKANNSSRIFHPCDISDKPKFVGRILGILPCQVVCQILFHNRDLVMILAFSESGSFVIEGVLRHNFSNGRTIFDVLPKCVNIGSGLLYSADELKLERNAGLQFLHFRSFAATILWLKLRLFSLSSC